MTFMLLKLGSNGKRIALVILIYQLVIVTNVFLINRQDIAYLP